MTYVKRGLPIRGNMLHRQDGNISVVLWQDTKPVLMTSTAHDPTTTITTTKKTNGNTISIECQKSIAEYNKFMGRVDFGDQYRKYYQVRMKSKSTYKYISGFSGGVYSQCIYHTLILPLYTSKPY